MARLLLALNAVSRLLSVLAIRLEEQALLQELGTRPPLLFVHIHKSAGSHMCKAALRAGERIVRPSDNCNWQPFDDFASRGRTDLKRTCAQRSEFFRRSGFTYAHIERELRAEDLCHEDFSYGTLLREPLARMRSHLAFEDMPKEAVVADLKAQTLKGQLLQTEEGSPQEEPNFRVLDNYQVRILANAMNAPAGGITAEHLRLAQERLANFEIVGAVEELGTPEGRGRLLQGFGWSGILSDAAFSSHENMLQTKHTHFTEEEEQFLKEANEHDIALYAWVRKHSRG